MPSAVIDQFRQLTDVVPNWQDGFVPYYDAAADKIKFRALPAIDTRPPAISNVAVSSIMPNSATVTWDTDETSNSQVEWGSVAGQFGNVSALNSTGTLNHTINLTGLPELATVYYRCKSVDAAGNIAYSTERNFQTTSSDTTAPTISGLTASGITTNGATIQWTTSEAADGLVQWGTAPGVYSGSSGILPMLLTHSFTIGGLATGTTVYYRVTSKDAAGNTAVSAEGSFDTLGSGGAALPQAVPDVSMPDLSTYTLKTIRNVGGDYTPNQFQQALNDAQPGWIIQIDSDVVITMQNFTPYQLPVKANPLGKWIIVRTANLAGLPTSGNVVVPGTHAAAMPKIRTNTNNQPCVATVNGDGVNISNHWRFIGIEFTQTAPLTQLSGSLIELGTISQNDINRIPAYFIIDRCYVHSDAATNIRRGINLHCAWGAVVDSYVDDCHDVSSDAQAILMGSGPGPYLIQNCDLYAAGENILSGGYDNSITNLVTADITVRKCRLRKKLSWKTDEEAYAGFHWSVKNLFELKRARRVLVEYCILEGCWIDGQTGWGVTLTPRNQDGNSPWSTVEDVTIRHNVIRFVNRPFDILADDYPNHTPIQKRLLITNNLFYWYGSSRWGGTGDTLLIIGADPYNHNAGLDGPDGVTVTHNTMLPPSHGKIIAGDGPNHPNWVFRDNIAYRGSGGVFQSATTEGNGALTTYFQGIDFTKNVLIAFPQSAYNQFTNNFFPADFTAVGFNDYNANDYRLALSSAYHNAASDGIDPGANLDFIAAGMGLTYAQMVADTFEPWLRNIAATPGASTGTIAWTTDELSDSEVIWGTASGNLPNSVKPTPNSNVTSHSVPLGTLPASTTIYYRVKSKDAAGNTATSKERTFVTLAAGDTTPPVISNVQSSVTTTTATITWNTDEAADTQVSYGTVSGSLGSSTALIDTAPMVTSHSQQITGLTAGTQYFYRVKSRDAAGNLATAAEGSFTASSSTAQGIITNGSNQYASATLPSTTSPIDWTSIGAWTFEARFRALRLNFTATQRLFFLTNAFRIHLTANISTGRLTGGSLRSGESTTGFVDLAGRTDMLLRIQFDRSNVYNAGTIMMHMEVWALDGSGRLYSDLGAMSGSNFNLAGQQLGILAQNDGTNPCQGKCDWMRWFLGLSPNGFNGTAPANTPPTGVTYLARWEFDGNGNDAAGNVGLTLNNSPAFETTP